MTEKNLLLQIENLHARVAETGDEILRGVDLAIRDGLQDVWRLLDPAGRAVDVRVQGRFESNYGEALRDAALAGLGIAMHSAWHVHRDLREGRLRVVLPDHPVPASGIHAVMPGRTLVPPRVRAFVDYLAERFADPPWRLA